MIKVSDRDKGNISASILSASDVINKKIDSLSVKLNNLMSLLIEKNNDLGKMLVEVDKLKGEIKDICEDSADFTGTQTCPGFSYSGLIDKIKQVERELDGIDTDITIEDYCTGGYQDHIDNPDQGPGCTGFGVCNVYSIDGCDSYCQGYGDYCIENFGGGDLDIPGGESTIPGGTYCALNYADGHGNFCMVDYDSNKPCAREYSSTATESGETCVNGYKTDTIDCEGMFANDSCTDGYTYADDNGWISCDTYSSDSCNKFSDSDGNGCYDYAVSGGDIDCQGGFQIGDGTTCQSIFEVGEDGSGSCGKYSGANGDSGWGLTVDKDGHTTGCLDFETETGSSCKGFTEEGGDTYCAGGFKSDAGLNCPDGYSEIGGYDACTSISSENCPGFKPVVGCNKCFNVAYSTINPETGEKQDITANGDGTITVTTQDTTTGETHTEVVKPDSGGTPPSFGGVEITSSDITGFMEAARNGCQQEVCAGIFDYYAGLGY